MQIRGTVAVVTGASSGIGRATALALGKAGADVVVASRRLELLRELAAEIESGGGGRRALAIKTDVTDPSQLDALAATVAIEFGRCDILVNNAGIPAHGSFDHATSEQIEYSVKVNLLGVIQGTRAFLPTMLAAGRGHIINMASLAGRHAVPGGSLYSATKHGVMAFSESVSYEVRDRGVRITAIAPGFVETPGFPQGHLNPRMVIDMDKVVAAILHAIRRDAGPQVSVPRAAGIFEAFRVATPGPYRWVMRRFVSPRHRPDYLKTPDGNRDDDSDADGD